MSFRSRGILGMLTSDCLETAVLRDLRYSVERSVHERLIAIPRSAEVPKLPQHLPQRLTCMCMIKP
jgi:hypothetical protein